MDPVIERIVRSREPQTVESAMRRGELTDNEAYFVLRFAGRLGYMRAMDALHDKFSLRHLLGRLRRNVLWIGGWEHPLLGQWDAGMPAWEPRRNGKWRDPTPLPIGPFTYYGWGGNLTLPGGDHLVFTHRGYDAPLEVYISPDGTPSHEEVVWLVGGPRGRR